MSNALLEAIKNKEPSAFNETLGGILKEKALEAVQEIRNRVYESYGFEAIKENDSEDDKSGKDKDKESEDKPKDEDKGEKETEDKDEE